MKELVRMLYDEKYSCIVENYGEIFTFTQHGIADLYDMVKNKPCFLKEAIVADKVVGKAAAALLILGEVKNVYAGIISLSALVLLREAGIDTDFGRVVPFIWNRDETDCCPLERMFYEENSPEVIFRMLERFSNAKGKSEISELSCN